MAFLKYTLLRTLLLLATGAVLYLLGMRGVLLLLVALVLSGLASVVVLRGPREQASAALSGRLTSIRTRMDERTGAEDAWDDAQRSAGDPSHEPGDDAPRASADPHEPGGTDADPPPPTSPPDRDAR
jgi:hypothetical protein